METRDLDRIRFVTKNFGNLQGLRYLVPLGLVMLSWAGASHVTSWPQALLRAALFLGAFFLMAAAGRYYRSTFGEVERPHVVQPVSEFAPLSIYNHLEPARRLPSVIPAVPRFMLLAWLALSVFLLFQFLFWSPWIVVNSELVWTGSSAATNAFITQAIYFLCGSLFLGIWWLRGCSLSRSYPFGIGALLLGLSVLAPRFLPAAGHRWTALLLCGSSMVVSGFLDHWQLVRMLGRRSR
jgi:hypothetical protein